MVAVISIRYFSKSCIAAAGKYCRGEHAIRIGWEDML